MTLRNVSGYSQRIKIKQPKLACFTLTCSKEGMIAPGLEIKITVGFENKNNEEVSDKIVIKSDDENEMEIPIYVYPQISKLVFDPFINFGFIKSGTTKEVIFPIENIGNVAAEFKLQVHCIEQGCLKIEPEELRIEAREKRTVKMTITGK